jgi:menaquinone-dependent protoporphyrinogen IX oxidase
MGLSASSASTGNWVALESYDAVAIGSAIHNQTWLAPAAAFVRNRATILSKRPAWLFSVTSIGETSSFFGP